MSTIASTAGAAAPAMAPQASVGASVAGPSSSTSEMTPAGSGMLLSSQGSTGQPASALIPVSATAPIQVVALPGSAALGQNASALTDAMSQQMLGAEVRRAWWELGCMEGTCAVGA
jgi:hypothetical protein